MSQLERLKLAVIKAQEMRLAQRAYFASRDRSALERSKRLERETDTAIADALRPDDLMGQ